MKVIFIFRISLFVTMLYACTKKTTSPQIRTIIYGTVKDTQGNVYKTVQIGTQIWMSENLKTTVYNDSTTIFEANMNDDWKNNITGAYCSYHNEYYFKQITGLLYNWYAVNTKKLAPRGWHVATEKDFDTLINYLGHEREKVSKALKSKTLWLTPDNNTDSVGFTALPGGARAYTAYFSSFGTNCYFWTQDQVGVEGIFYNIYNDSNLGLYPEGMPKKAGLSVRCVKDK